MSRMKNEVSPFISLSSQSAQHVHRHCGRLVEVVDNIVSLIVSTRAFAETGSYLVWYNIRVGCRTIDRVYRSYSHESRHAVRRARRFIIQDIDALLFLHKNLIEHRLHVRMHTQ